MKILLVAGRPPWPPRRGDQLRASQTLEALRGEHEVTLLAPAAPDEPPLAGVRREAYRRGATTWLAAAARLLRGWPVQALPFHQRDLARQLRRLAPRHDLVVLQLVRLAPHLRDTCGRPVMADLVDCLSLNVTTRAAVSPAWLRPALRVEARRVAAAERAMVAASRRALVVCERDRSALGEGAPEVAAKVYVLAVAIRGASDAAAQPGGARASQGTPPTVAITGNLGYFPNRDAVTWWLDEVWPALRRIEPALRLVVAGDRPPRSMRRRVRRAGGELIAKPPDLVAVLAGATVAAAPLRCGSGVPLKVLDAWSVGVPVVASRFAAEGAGARDEHDALVAESPEEWIAAMRRLLFDPALRARLAEAGRERAESLTLERMRAELLRLVALAAS